MSKHRGSSRRDREERALLSEGYADRTLCVYDDEPTSEEKIKKRSSGQIGAEHTFRQRMLGIE